MIPLGYQCGAYVRAGVFKCPVRKEDISLWFSFYSTGVFPSPSVGSINKDSNSCCHLTWYASPALVFFAPCPRPYINYNSSPFSQVHSDPSLYLKCWSRLPSSPYRQTQTHFSEVTFLNLSLCSDPMTPRIPQYLVHQLLLSLPILTQSCGISPFSSLISPLRSRSRLTDPTAYLLTLLPFPVLSQT